MAIDYAALKTELLADSQGYGYAPYLASGNDTMLANLLNQVRPAIQIKRADIGPSEIFHALALSDMVTNAQTTQIGWMEALLDAPYTIRLLNEDGTDTPVQANILSLLKAGTTDTKTRLAALRTRAGSRGEQLFGASTFISIADIALARNA